MKRLKCRSGQSTLEYAILIAVIVAALIGIQTYIGRAMKGKLRDSADNIGEQYSAGHMSGDYTINVERGIVDEFFGTNEAGGMGVSYSSTAGGKTTKTGSESTLLTLSEESLTE